MFRFKIRGVSCGLSFSFFAVIAFLSLSNATESKMVMWALLSCMLHECGHFGAMAINNEKPKAVVFYGGGIRITPPCCANDKATEAVILLSGCAMNFICAVVTYALSGMCFFCEINLFLGVFNLLPFRYFDGGRLFEILFSRQVYFVVRLVFIVAVIALYVFALLNGIFSVSFSALLAYVVLSELLYKGAIV